MRYIDHIRNMSDDQLAYFLNAIQPEITLWSLSMMRALSRKPYEEYTKFLRELLTL